MNPQTAGLEELEGTYVFDLRTSNRTLAFNRFFRNMIRAEHREAFWADEESAMDAAGLGETEKALVRARLAGDHSLRRQLLRAGEVGARGEDDEPRSLCDHARGDA